MGNKLIFRVEKLPKHLVQSRVQHALREIPCPDADPERKHLNIRHGPETFKEFRDHLKTKLKGVRIFRADSPPVLEIFISASPDFFKRGGDYKKLFQDSYAELAKRFGAENILLLTIHHDETSPHLSAFIVPLAKNPEVAEYEAEQRGEPRPPPAKGKKGHRRTAPFVERPPEICLSAKAYIDGPRSLSRLQTQFWEAAGKGVGLERGIEGSKARHVKVNDWKKMMAWVEDGMPMPEFVMPELSSFDRLLPDRLEAAIRAAYASQFEEIIKLANILAADATQKITKTESTAKRLNELKKHLETVQAELTEREAQMEAEIAKRSAASAYKIAEAGLSQVVADLAELKQRREADAAALAAPAAPDPIPAKLNVALSDRAVLIRALAKTIKQDHQGERMAVLAAEMGVPAGKGDIFDRLVKSGQASSFEAAVLQVAAHINLEVEGGGRNAAGVVSEPEIRL